MVNRLVTVDDNFDFPAAVQARQSATVATQVATVAVRRADDAISLTFTKQPGPVVTAAAAGISTLYWPSVINAKSHYPAALDTYYMYVSTNHGGGGIHLLSAPSPSGPWTPRGLVYNNVATSGGTSLETPDVVWDAQTSKFVMTYQLLGATGVFSQQTSFWAESVDGVTWVYGGKAIDFAGTDQGVYAGHTGYTRLTQVGDYWLAHHLYSGGDWGRFGTSQSRDARNFAMNPFPIEPSPQFATTPARRVNVDQAFLWDGQWLGLGREKPYVSGATSAGTNLVVGPLTPDLREYRTAPTKVLPIGTQGWETDDMQSSFIFVEDGKAWLYYQLGNSIGLMTAGA